MKCQPGMRIGGAPAAERYLKGGYWYLSGYPDHPLSSRSGCVAEHRKALYGAIGEGPHSCHWGCGRTLTWGGSHQLTLTADHLDGNQHNNAPDNLVPACRPCNTKRRHAGNPVDWHVETHSGATACQRGHDFTPENTYEDSRGKRQCRTCHRDRQARYKAERLSRVSGWSVVGGEPT